MEDERLATPPRRVRPRSGREGEEDARLNFLAAAVRADDKRILAIQRQIDLVQGRLAAMEETWRTIPEVLKLTFRDYGVLRHDDLGALEEKLMDELLAQMQGRLAAMKEETRATIPEVLSLTLRDYGVLRQDDLRALEQKLMDELLDGKRKSDNKVAERLMKLESTAESSKQGLRKRVASLTERMKGVEDRTQELEDLMGPSIGTYDETFEVGPEKDVLIVGLKSRQDLNGKLGRVVMYEQARDRWQVQVADSSERILLREENMDHPWPPTPPCRPEGAQRGGRPGRP